MDGTDGRRCVEGSSPLPILPTPDFGAGPGLLSTTASERGIPYAIAESLARVGVVHKQLTLLRYAYPL